jgi:hypothetical protein
MAHRYAYCAPSIYLLRATRPLVRRASSSPIRATEDAFARVCAAHPRSPLCPLSHEGGIGQRVCARPRSRKPAERSERAIWRLPPPCGLSGHAGFLSPRSGDESHGLATGTEAAGGRMPRPTRLAGYHRAGHICVRHTSHVGSRAWRSGDTSHGTHSRWHPPLPLTRHVTHRVSWPLRDCLRVG